MAIVSEKCVPLRAKIVKNCKNIPMKKRYITITMMLAVVLASCRFGRGDEKIELTPEQMRLEKISRIK